MQTNIQEVKGDYAIEMLFFKQIITRSFISSSRVVTHH